MSDQQQQPDLQEELAKKSGASSNKLTLGLVGLVLLAAGFGGGIFLGKSQSASAEPGGGGFGRGGYGQGQFPGGGAPGGENGTGQNGTGQNGTGQNGTGQNGTGGQPGQGGPVGAMGNFTAGTITKVDGDTITVKLQDGSTVTVKTDTETTVTLSDTGKVSDLKSGDTIVVRGQKTDDTVDAESINEGAGLGARGNR